MRAVIFVMMSYSLDANAFVFPIPFSESLNDKTIQASTTLDRSQNLGRLGNTSTCYLLFAFGQFVHSLLADTNYGHMSSGQLIQHMASRFMPAVGASLRLLPIVILDSLRLSNRFCGPHVYGIRITLDNRYV